VLEQPANGLVRAIALVADFVARGREGREDVPQPGKCLVPEGVQPAWFEPLQVVVEGIDEDPERQLVLELRGAAG
jgi:hypothetical protein